MTLLIVNIVLVIVPQWLIFAFHTKGRILHHYYPRQLYTLLKPEKLGTIIQNFRMDRVKKMREEGKTNQEISEVTGLSVSYLKKIKG